MVMSTRSRGGSRYPSGAATPGVGGGESEVDEEVEVAKVEKGGKRSVGGVKKTSSLKASGKYYYYLF